jgi:hypothetical protein
VLDIVIPSKTERFLEKTIRDVLAKATGEIEVYPVLDGYEPPESEIVDDPRVHYVHFGPTRAAKKRQAINHVAEVGAGEHIMSLDAHCMMAPGFDEALIRDHRPDWVQVPRRHRLDAESWCLQTQVDSRPPIDYEYLIWPGKFVNPAKGDGFAFHGFKWDERTLSRANLPIDDIITFQGSCWLMTKEWFWRCGFMQVEGYTGWGQEAEEISFTTWYNGGRVVVNKNTWYAHLHKGPTYGRMYYLDVKDCRKSYKYSFDLWANQRKEFFVSLVERFWPLPGWPSNWKERLWK